MNKKLVLSGAAFMLAIGGAFASQILFAEPAYTSKVDIPEQELLCEQREACLNNSGPACVNTIPITYGSQTYAAGTVPFFKLVGEECEIPLKRD